MDYNVFVLLQFMGTQECFWENFARTHEGADLSRKGDHLILNGNFIRVFEALYRTELTTVIVGEICRDACRGCTASIKQTPHTIAIDREGYSYIPPSERVAIPFIQSSEFYPDEGNPRGRITVVDDRSPFELARKLALSGFLTKGLKVNPDEPYSRERQGNIYSAIVGTQPRLVFIDKGLGNHSGLDTIEQLGKLQPNITTVLYSGEWDSGETSRAGAGFFITKGYEEEGKIQRVLELCFPQEV